jgi:hypothetical protein
MLPRGAVSCQDDSWSWAESLPSCFRAVGLKLDFGGITWGHFEKPCAWEPPPEILMQLI